jgi:hypothetical protein
MTRVGESDFEPELAELAAADERRLGELLQNAWSPRELDAARHERLLEAALEDPFAAASAEERAQSDRLRRALDGQGEHENLRLARALSAAFAPHLDRPLAEPELAAKAGQRRSRRVIFQRFAGVASALAVAAVALLWLAPARRTSSAPAPDLATLVLVQSRSTAEFFQANSAGAPSARIDRIASARSRDLRDNRYALWGVR